MENESISQWVVLSYACNDASLITMISPDWFTGIPRLVLDQLIALKEPVKELLYEKVLDAFPEHYGKIRENIEKYSIYPNLDNHIMAISNSWKDRRIKDIIEDASQRINMGESREVIAEEAISRLSSIHGQSIVDTIDDIESMMEEHHVIKTGVPELGIDEWEMGNVMSLGGDTGTFKTTLAIWMSLRALKANPDLHVIYFAKEQPRREMWHKIFSSQFKINYTDVQAKFNLKNPSFYNDMMNLYKNEDLLKRFHVIDQKNFFTMTDIIYYLRANKNYKIMYIIDYLLCLSFDPKNLNTDIANNLQRLKSATISTDSFGIVINQFLKNWNMDRGMVIPRYPTKDDMIWSSEMRNLSAYILLLYHPASYFTDFSRKNLFVCWGKVRHSEMDAKIPLIINGNMQSFHTPNMEQKIEVDKITTFMKRRY